MSVNTNFKRELRFGRGWTKRQATQSKTVVFVAPLTSHEWELVREPKPAVVPSLPCSLFLFSVVHGTRECQLTVSQCPRNGAVCCHSKIVFF
jgi:hypothetical protein